MEKIKLSDLKGKTKEEIKELIKNRKLAKEGKIIKHNKKSRMKSLSAQEIIDQEKIIKDRKHNHHVEERNAIETSKLSSDIKRVLSLSIKEFKSDLQEQFKELFKEELKKLNDKGLFYKSEFKELTLSEYSKIGTKKMGERGWHFCCTINEEKGTILFQRMLKLGEE
jgi:hypothetical protein